MKIFFNNQNNEKEQVAKLRVNDFGEIYGYSSKVSQYVLITSICLSKDNPSHN